MENTIPQRLKSRVSSYGFSQWEGAYEHLYHSLQSYTDIKTLVLGDDPNTKIFAIREIVPWVVDLLSTDEQKDCTSR